MRTAGKAARRGDGYRLHRASAAGLLRAGGGPGGLQTKPECVRKQKGSENVIAHYRFSEAQLATRDSPGNVKNLLVGQNLTQSTGADWRRHPLEDELPSNRAYAESTTYVKFTERRKVAKVAKRTKGSLPESLGLGPAFSGPARMGLGIAGAAVRPQVVVMVTAIDRRIAIGDLCEAGGDARLGDGDRSRDEESPKASSPSAGPKQNRNV